jgi:hypothetical protein
MDSRTKTSDEKRGNPKMHGAQKQIPPMKKSQITEARSANITLEGEGDVFRFHQE